MPTDPAPEKVAALAALLDLIFWRRFSESSTESFARALGAALNAAGYDVTRIEEGERLRSAADYAVRAMRQEAWHESEIPKLRTAEAHLRAALAASDEAVRP